ncbi:MAG: hypothetical protein OXT49_08470 [Gammaproteobacteria bacterium]|nr:hypothetical protein [Gammaproteobacteria bacterium]
MKKLSLAAAVAATALVTNVHAVDDTMNNIVTVTEACDVVAIGVDFGQVGTPTPAAGHSTFTANTALLSTNALQSTGHGGAAADDGKSLTLSLLGVNVPVPFTAASGVFVFCTSAPGTIEITGTNVDSAPVALPKDLSGAASPVTVESKMDDLGAGSDQLDYSFTFGAPTALATPATLPSIISTPFIGSYLVTGASIDGSQSVAAGFYQDTVTVTVTP